MASVGEKVEWSVCSTLGGVLIKDYLAGSKGS